MAEIEIGVMSRQCLARRIPDIEMMKNEAAAWVRNRNAAKGTVHWQFTTPDARVKLQRLYPKI
jgi:predicted AAA+ superfamily ATPase